MTQRHPRAATPVHLGVVCAVTAACASTHISRTPPRQRDYTAGAYAQHDPNSRPTAGSLFSGANPGYLEDTRAVRVGDVVVVNIAEHADASGATGTQLSRASAHTLAANGFFGLTSALHNAFPDIDPAHLLDVASQSTFNGTGNTSRAGDLSGAIAVRVTREMPNGDLFVEGTKVVLVNNEEYHLYISGLVRPVDIAPDNSVLSSRIADAQVEFTGQGDLAEQNHRGWLAKLLDIINPF